MMDFPVAAQTVWDAPERLVLDTNIVLDWLHFDDPRARELNHRVQSGRVHLYSSDSTLCELQRVLAYPQFSLSETAQLALLAQYQALSQCMVVPDHPKTSLPVCRDPDDQKFLELALACNATRLLSKDKRLLELSRSVIQKRFKLPFVIESWSTTPQATGKN